MWRLRISNMFQSNENSWISADGPEEMYLKKFSKFVNRSILCML